jgi:hypothetical protein
MIFQDLSYLHTWITYLHKTSEDCQSACKKEMDRMDSLYHKKMKLEVQFENNNEVYVKLRKTIEEKVMSILSDGRMLLK